MSSFRVAVAWVLALLVASPVLSQEAGTNGPGGRGFSLELADPNPFETETRIPFVLAEDLFEDRDRVIVSMRVYNLLHQAVGIPFVVEEGGERVPLAGLAFAGPGRHVARWDGTDLEGEPVTAGPYFIQLLVDGRSQVRKVLLAR